MSDKIYLTLTFDSKIICICHDGCCNLHTIGNNFAKYEHPRSQMNKELAS